MIILLFCRHDRHSLKGLEEMFSPEKKEVWFVEKTDTQEWITKDNDAVCLEGYDYSKTNPSSKFIIYQGMKMFCKYDKTQLTNDPINTLQFKSEISAMAYIIKNKLGKGFSPTEHEFVGA